MEERGNRGGVRIEGGSGWKRGEQGRGGIEGGVG